MCSSRSLYLLLCLILFLCLFSEELFWVTEPILTLKVHWCPRWLKLYIGHYPHWKSNRTNSACNWASRLSRTPVAELRKTGSRKGQATCKVGGGGEAHSPLFLSGGTGLWDGSLHARLLLGACWWSWLFGRQPLFPIPVPGVAQRRCMAWPHVWTNTSARRGSVECHCLWISAQPGHVVK